jgi:hypothetical protein
VFQATKVPGDSEIVMFPTVTLVPELLPEVLRNANAENVTPLTVDEVTSDGPRLYAYRSEPVVSTSLSPEIDCGVSHTIGAARVIDPVPMAKADESTTTRAPLGAEMRIGFTDHSSCNRQSWGNEEC